MVRYTRVRARACVYVCVCVCVCGLAFAREHLLLMAAMCVHKRVNLQEGQARVERMIFNILREDARATTASSADAPQQSKSQAKRLLQHVFAPLLDGADDVELINALRGLRESNKSKRENGEMMVLVSVFAFLNGTDSLAVRSCAESVPTNGAFLVGVK